MRTYFQITMITGDNAMTACHVAGELGFCSNNPLVFDGTASNSVWESVDGHQRVNVDDVGSRKVMSDLCLTGPGLEWMVRSQYRDLRRVLPLVKVFARFTPTQKEWLVNELKHLGYFTLMCGDGTNDVGALKHSHVGVALLQKAVVAAEKLKASYADGTGETMMPLLPPNSGRSIEVSPPTGPRRRNMVR